MVKFVLLKL